MIEAVLFGGMCGKMIVTIICVPHYDLTIKRVPKALLFLIIVFLILLKYVDLDTHMLHGEDYEGYCIEV